MVGNEVGKDSKQMLHTLNKNFIITSVGKAAL
jgi:hypothetical protein